MLDKPDITNVVNNSVNLLNRFAKIFRKNRIDMGALTLASPEVRFKIETGNLIIYLDIYFFD